MNFCIFVFKVFLKQSFILIYHYELFEIFKFFSRVLVTCFEDCISFQEYFFEKLVIFISILYVILIFIFILINFVNFITHLLGFYRILA